MSDQKEAVKKTMDEISRQGVGETRQNHKNKVLDIAKKFSQLHSSKEEAPSMEIELSEEEKKQRALDELASIVQGIKKSPVEVSKKTLRENEKQVQEEVEKNEEPLDMKYSEPDHSPKPKMNTSAFDFLINYYDKLQFRHFKGNIYDVVVNGANKQLDKLQGKTVVRIKYAPNDLGGIYTVAYSLNKEPFQADFSYDKNGSKKRYMVEKEVFNYLMDALINVSTFLRTLETTKKVIKLNEINDSGALAGTLQKNIPDVVYHHADAPGISNSILSLIEQSPMMLDAKYVKSVIEKDEERYFVVGRAFHDFVLLPEIFYENNYVIPERVDGQFWEIAKKITELESIGKNKVTQKEFELFQIAKRQLELHPTARYLLREGESEVSAYKKTSFGNKNKKYSILSRVRFDKLIQNPSEELKDIMYYEFGIPRDQNYFLILDLKFLKDNTDLDNVAANAFTKFRYNNAGAYYLDVAEGIIKKKGYFVFVTVSKTGVCDVMCYVLDEDDISDGRQNYMANIRKYVDEYTNAFYPLIHACDNMLGQVRAEMNEDYGTLMELVSGLHCKFDPREQKDWNKFLSDEIEKIEPIKLILDKYPSVKKELIRKIGWRGRHSGIQTLKMPFRASREIDLE